MRSSACLFAVLLVACTGGAAPSDPPSSEPAAEGASAREGDDEAAGRAGTENPGSSGPVAGSATGSAEGNTCAYASTPGTATITAIEAPGERVDTCANDGRVARFTFKPDGDAPAVPESLAQVDAGNRSLRIGNKAPPSACLTELGVTVGATFRATRRLATMGTCTPVLYDVEVALASCKTRCE